MLHNSVTPRLAVACCLVLVYPVIGDSRIPLYLSYITSLTGQGITSIGEIPALELALEQINNNKQLLLGYTLNVSDIVDSKVGSVVFMQNSILFSKYSVKELIL